MAADARQAPSHGLEPDADFLRVIPAASPGRETGRCERPEIPLQPTEKIDSAPGIGAGPSQSAADARQAPSHGLEPDADFLRAIPAASPGRETGRCERPETPPQPTEKIDSAPGIGARPSQLAAEARQPPSRGLEPDADFLRAIPAASPGRETGRCERPEIPPQPTEKIDFAPENMTGLGADGLAAPSPSPRPIRGLTFFPRTGYGVHTSRTPGGRPLPAAKAGERGARPQIICASDSANGEKGRSIASPGDAGAQNPSQALEMIDSAPGSGGLEAAAPPPPEFPVVGIRLPTLDGGFKIAKVRMTADGVMAACPRRLTAGRGGVRRPQANVKRKFAGRALSRPQPGARRTPPQCAPPSSPP